MASIAVGAVVAASLAAPAAAEQAAWQQWQHLSGVVDVGARPDGSLVVMAAGHLFSVSHDGASSPFAAGPDGYVAGSPDAESYFVVVPALTVDAAACSFNPGDLFLLDLTAPPAIARIDPAGRATRFAILTGVDTLGGIAIDTTGRFGYRLLVTGTHANNQTSVFAVDCLGVSTLLTDSAPPLEGGLAVAPATFGQFAGDLIAPDENTGQMWAIDPSGAAVLMSAPNLPTGGDTGVESVGFIPPGFTSGPGGFAYLADRGTPNNPFAGNDSLLRLDSAALVSAGVEDGDLLVSTEGVRTEDEPMLK
ncbi:MAG: hypothetical protein LC797_06790 [Chloroflexi bacterium]|nr:hypothetical protein [Chloroflexota bacterium]